jgi:hypothetical protein
MLLTRAGSVSCDEAARGLSLYVVETLFPPDRDMASTFCAKYPLILPTSIAATSVSSALGGLEPMQKFTTEQKKSPCQALASSASRAGQRTLERGRRQR